ncbi:hypothetical protein NMY22_g3455 [Coprinellus aureogranulatus]|nr:hypothetical protein NMY22_g3455 [Coprinellus aureogranulatus]
MAKSLAQSLGPKDPCPTGTDSDEDVEQCPDCDLFFPLLPTSSLCKKCIRLKSLVRGTNEYTKVMVWFRCRAFRSASCIKYAEEGSDESQAPDVPVKAPVKRRRGAEVPATYGERLVAVRQRLKLAKPKPAENALTTARLLQREEEVKASGRKNRDAANGIPVNWLRPRHNRLGSTNKESNMVLGERFALTFPEDEPVPSMKKHFLDHVNLGWRRSGSRALLIDEISIFLGGNYALDDGMASGTLSSLIPSKRSTVTPTASGTKIVNLELHLEILIHDDLFEARVEEVSDVKVSGKGGKKGTRRGRTSSKGMDPPIPSSKTELCAGNLAFNSEAMPSMFSQAYRHGSFRNGVVDKTTTVEFSKVVCDIDTEANEVRFRHAGLFKGHLSDVPFANGSMKQAHRLVVEEGGKSQFFAAERFFRLSTDDTATPGSRPDNFSIMDHNDKIKKECLRAGLAAHMLEEFYKHAETLGVMDGVYERLEIAECFAAFEEPEKNPKPSPASGMRFFEFGGDPDTYHEAIMFLVELYRRASEDLLQKYSGTMQHYTHASDLLSMTIYALTHFVYWYSDHLIVLADVQGTPGRVKGGDGFIIFDVMTHTADGDSGVGDFGKEGIETFKSQHVCKEICRRLQLPEIRADVSDLEDLDECEVAPATKRRKTTNVLRRSSGNAPAPPKAEDSEESKGVAQPYGQEEGSESGDDDIASLPSLKLAGGAAGDAGKENTKPPAESD